MGHVQTRINYIYYVGCVVAPFSVLGSSLTLVALFRSNRAFDTYSRLVSCIAVYDILLSTALSFGSTPIPEETGVPRAKGNLNTCTAQATVIYIGSASFAYCTMLMWYYVAVIRYGITEKFMVRYIEPWMHLIASGFFVVCSIIGLQWQIFNFAAVYCFVAAWPLGCTDSDEIECLRGGDREPLFGLWLTTVPFMVFTCLILLALIVVSATVVRRHCKSRRFDFRISSASPFSTPVSQRQQEQQSNLSRETRQVVVQCVLYAVVFANVMVWSTLGTILYLRGVEYDALTDPLFATDALALFFFPLNGFLLFCIFLRPRYLRMRKQYSRLQSVKEAIWNPDQNIRQTSSSSRRQRGSNRTGSSNGGQDEVDLSPGQTDEKVSNEAVEKLDEDETPRAVEESASASSMMAREIHSTAGSSPLRKFFFLSLVLGCGLCRHITAFSTKTDDMETVARQLGYAPTNFVKVSSRNKNGAPVAIQTYPLHGGAPRRQDKARRSVVDPSDWLGTPFPTLYWLTCPDISKCIADLEREGYVKLLEKELLRSGAMTQQLRLAHQDYAMQRWRSLSENDVQQIIALSRDSPTMERVRWMLECSGIAGSNVTLATAPPVKCLHTHYAHYRSQGMSGGSALNPVGARVHEVLGELFPYLVL